MRVDCWAEAQPAINLDVRELPPLIVNNVTVATVLYTLRDHCKGI